MGVIMLANECWRHQFLDGKRYPVIGSSIKISSANCWSCRLGLNVLIVNVLIGTMLQASYYLCWGSFARFITNQLSVVCVV